MERIEQWGGRSYGPEARDEPLWLAEMILRRKFTDYLSGSPLVGPTTIHVAIRLCRCAPGQVARILEDVCQEADGKAIRQERYDQLVRQLRERKLLPPQGGVAA